MHRKDDPRFDKENAALVEGIVFVKKGKRAKNSMFILLPTIIKPLKQYQSTQSLLSAIYL